MTDTLPPLPEPTMYGPSGTAPIGYSVNQMRAYAAAAVAAEREACAALADDVAARTVQTTAVVGTVVAHLAGAIRSRKP